ncbi:hypothetical protein BKA25_003195 [Actinoalloteichus hymeniacidonis]|uniref:Secreted protein n=1 Tax=Actinoalloteichus hymeniacidonis TaxID=340345 RepID=A0AAC9HPJ4_9PSEU|nr:hypothetical protein [Actinoalloteichus hymeniacidonis]AOS63085.1 hypothetical protein TL08_11355 [Actinoalloteichus hymeniacidonis]MBB5908879.1 hypothetical protein [Actinoalloteichus hymeniacidonis]
MSRLFWFGAGIAAGIAVSRRMAEAARQATPAGIAANVGDAVRELAVAVGSFGADVRAGMDERERELADIVEVRTGSTTRTDPAARSWVPGQSIPGLSRPVRTIKPVTGDLHRRAEISGALPPVQAARGSRGRARRAGG